MDISSIEDTRLHHLTDLSAQAKIFSHSIRIGGAYQRGKDFHPSSDRWELRTEREGW
jgi:hypothetical protein